MHTIIGKPPVKNLPRTASVEGGRDEKGAMARKTTEKGAMAKHTTEKGALNMARQTPVKALPRTVSVAGERDEESELKESTGAKTRGNKAKTLPQATIVAGEATTPFVR